MKTKQLIIKGCIVFAIGVIGVLGFSKLTEMEVAGDNDTKEGHGIALSVPGHQDLKSLAVKTGFILSTNVDGEYNVVENKIEGENEVYSIDHHYKLIVEKTAKDKSGNKLEKGDVVDLIIPTGVQQKLNGKIGGLIPLSDNTIALDNGKYLLFLETTYYKPFDKNVMMISNLNHVYKKVGKNYKNIGSDLIPEIKEDYEF
ncbi:hypothetical protein [Paenisporosarcina indica]|uniref:hypothetical protein n=1 Tax=Paenisporosarcina indica TaxID=650093 RepID=UPI00094FDA71|nr:hypothetical protein [Paenisporosarcina indica]